MWVVKGWAESVKEWGSTGAIEEVEMVAENLGFGKVEIDGELLGRERGRETTSERASEGGSQRERKERDLCCVLI